jgi:hypothetical protein
MLAQKTADKEERATKGDCLKAEPSRTVAIRFV